MVPVKRSFNVVMPYEDASTAKRLVQFAYLQRMAQTGNMECFVSTSDQPGETTGLSRLQMAERPRTAMLQENQDL